MVWTCAISIVADAADGADGMESVLTRGRDLDRPHSQSALAAEDDFNPEYGRQHSVLVLEPGLSTASKTNNLASVALSSGPSAGPSQTRHTLASSANG